MQRLTSVALTLYHALHLARRPPVHRSKDVANLPLMVALSGVILMEKLWRHGERFARVACAIAPGVASLAGLVRL